MQTGSYFDVMADYAVSQSYDKCYVYGMAGKKQNPPYLQQPLISSSFAKHDIPVTFEFNEIHHTLTSHKEVKHNILVVFICSLRHLGIVMTIY